PAAFLVPARRKRIPSALTKDKGRALHSQCLLLGSTSLPGASAGRPLRFPFIVIEPNPMPSPSNPSTRRTLSGWVLIIASAAVVAVLAFLIRAPDPHPE